MKQISMLKYPCAITQLGEWASLSTIQGSTELAGLGQPKGKAISALAFYRLKKLKGAPTWSHNLCEWGTLGRLKFLCLC